MEHLARLGFLLCALAPWLTAQAAEDPDPRPTPIHYGVRLLAAYPGQDFRQINSRTGLGAGLFAETQWTPATLVQTRLDYLRYPQTNSPGDPGISSYLPDRPLTLSADSVACGFDVRHDLSQRSRNRVFLLGGVMAIRYEFQSSALGTLKDQNGIESAGIVRFKSKTSLKLGLAAGFGCAFDSHWTLAERFTTIDIDGVTLATAETALSYRF